MKTQPQPAVGNVTYMCANGWHGTPERRYVTPESGFSGMYAGTCAGTLYYSATREQAGCQCACHDEAITETS